MLSTEALIEQGSLGHLASCHIASLFGRRDVGFKTSPAGPTLLYGANGMGKSTVLRLIDDVAHARWRTLVERPFEQIELKFVEGHRLAVTKSADGLGVALNEEYWEITAESFQRARRRMAARRRHESEYGRSHHLPTQWPLFADNEAPFWFPLIPNLFPVSLVSDQRLVLRMSRNRPDGMMVAETQSAVTHYPRELASQIQRGLGLYAAHSQELDSRFPMKIADAVESARPSSESGEELAELRDLLDRVRGSREVLEKVGLLGREEEPMHFDPGRLEAGPVRPVIRAFAEDTLAKFQVLEDLRVRLELFTSFLNQHYQDKSIIVDREEGFRILLEDSTLLDPGELSSGEQQVLAMAYQILFGTQPGTLLLIDEPELSLHVLWQSTLIEDFVAMGDARDVSFVLATHSPALIGDRNELMQSLDSFPSSSIVPTRDVDQEELFFELLEDETDVDDDGPVLDLDSDEGVNDSESSN